LIDEFLMNVVGMSLQEVFPTECVNFMSLFPSSGSA